MLKALLVDDEPLTIKLMKSIIDWNSYGIEIITATDGIEALEKFKKYNPEIIVSDIRMPGMDGIELIKKVKELRSDVNFISISAHADFDYVREVLKLGCSDYILKPIDEFEFEDTLKKLLLKINYYRENERMRTKNELQRKKQNLKNFMKTGTNLHNINRYLSAFPVLFSDYLIVSINANNDTINEYDQLTNMLYEQMSYVINRMNEIINKYCNNLIFDFEEDSWVIIFSGTSVDHTVKCANELIAFFKEEFQLTVGICFSNTAGSISQLPKLYKKVLQLNRYSFYKNNATLLGYGYNCIEEDFDSLEMLSLTKNILAALKHGKITEACETLDQAFTISENINPSCLEIIYEFCYKVILCVQEIISVSKERSVGGKEILQLTYHDIASIPSMEKLEAFMKRSIIQLQAEALPDLSIRYSDLVNKGIAILKQNYNKNLSLDKICEEIAVSKNYFCYLFKKETGKNLWSYLTELRMEQAVELLKTTKLKTYEIAYMIGYDNPSYFSKMFKSIFLMTPNEYRNCKNNIIS